MPPCCECARADPRPVDLDVIEGKELQVIEGGVAGTEVIEHELHAGVVQPLECLPRGHHVADEAAFGELEFERLRRYRHLGELTRDVVAQLRIAQHRR